MSTQAGQWGELDWVGVAACQAESRVGTGVVGSPASSGWARPLVGQIVLAHHKAFVPLRLGQGGVEPA